MKPANRIDRIIKIMDVEIKKININIGYKIYILFLTLRSHVLNLAQNRLQSSISMLTEKIESHFLCQYGRSSLFCVGQNLKSQLFSL